MNELPIVCLKNLNAASGREKFYSKKQQTLQVHKPVQPAS